MATLGDYMRWVESEGGHCRTGITIDPDIGMVPMVKMTMPSGRSVVFAGGDQMEPLSPSVIANFDRRLGRISPFGFPTAH